MRLTSWLGNPKRRPTALYRPRLEVLEDRSVPATFTVTTPFDAVDGGDDLLSLREAVLEANSAAGADTIDFAPEVAGTIALTGGQLSISDDVAINGPGAAWLAISGSATSRV